MLGTLQKVANGEQPDISRLLGIKSKAFSLSFLKFYYFSLNFSFPAESMSESETEQVEPDSSPLTITAAEKKVGFLLSLPRYESYIIYRITTHIAKNFNILDFIL